VLENAVSIILPVANKGNKRRIENFQGEGHVIQEANEKLNGMFLQLQKATALPGLARYPG
jgi:hypothetical protein